MNLDILKQAYQIQKVKICGGLGGAGGALLVALLRSPENLELIFFFCLIWCSGFFCALLSQEYNEIVKHSKK